MIDFKSKTKKYKTIYSTVKQKKWEIITAKSSIDILEVDILKY